MPLTSSLPPLQAQYVFIHDALDELVTCGDTSIASHNLRMKIGNLGKIVAGKIITGFQHQFEVSGLLCMHTHYLSPSVTVHQLNGPCE